MTWVMPAARMPRQRMQQERHAGGRQHRLGRRQGQRAQAGALAADQDHRVDRERPGPSFGAGWSAISAAQAVAVHGEGAGQGVAPVRQRGQPGRRPARGRQHRVRRPRRRPRERGGGRRQHPGRVGAELFEDRPGEAEPGRVAGVGAVIDARRARRSGPARPARAARSADQVGEPRWSSTTLTVSRAASSRTIVLTKLAPVAAVDPGRPHDVAGVGQQLAHGLLAGQLGPPVRRLRGRSGRRPRRARSRRRRRRSRSRRGSAGRRAAAAAAASTAGPAALTA